MNEEDLNLFNVKEANILSIKLINKNLNIKSLIIMNSK